MTNLRPVSFDTDASSGNGLTYETGTGGPVVIPYPGPTGATGATGPAGSPGYPSTSGHSDGEVLKIASGVPAWAAGGSSSGNIPFPEDYSCVADGDSGSPTDNATNLQTALNAGKGPVYLAPGKSYAFGSQLTIPSRGGFIGGGKLVMLTGTGKFDATTYASPFSTSQLGLYALNKIKPILECEVIMQANASIRTCTPIAVRGCTDPVINAYVSGFKEGCLIPYVCWDSNIRGRAFITGFDCTMNSTTLSPVQLTVFAVDGTRLNDGGGQPINSTPFIWDCIVDNITMGATALAHYGTDQTDGVDLGPANATLASIGRLAYRDVGEPLDIFGHGNIVDVAGKNARNVVAKMGHGASFNQGRVFADGFGLAGVEYYGSSDSGAYYNHFTFIGQRGGAVGNWSTCDAILTDGTSATFKPNNNYAGVLVKGDGTNLDHVINEQSGSNDLFVDFGSTGFAVGLSAYGVGSGNRVRRLRGSHVKAYLGSAQTLSNNTWTKMNFDTEVYDGLLEWDTSTKTFTAKSNVRLMCKTQMRTGSLSGGKFMLIRFMKNGSTELIRGETTNEGTAAYEEYVLANCITELVPGDTLTVEGYQFTGGNLTITAGEQYSFAEIEEF